MAKALKGDLACIHTVLATILIVKHTMEVYMTKLELYAKGLLIPVTCYMFFVGTRAETA